jgi:hypothetical protein
MPLAPSPWRRITLTMADLLLTPAADMEGKLSNFDFDVIADGQVVGRITLDLSGLMWFWTIDASLQGDRNPAEGHEASREAAMQAFARSWHSEM